MRLDVAPEVAFPLALSTETLLIVGKRGSGKSSTGTRLAEQLAAVRVQVAVLDPADVWWGLKAGKDGSREGGLDVYVFGGAHADLPLEPTAGALMADVLVDHRVNAVMVVRDFSNRDKARFVSDFAERLYRRMTGEFVLHLFCEEAHELMPERVLFKGTGEEEMLGRMLRLQKQGRTGGIGLTSITQRPASLNKNATTQAEILIAHRITGPQDVKAVEGWIKYHHVEELKQQVLATLPELKTGEAWVWAPDFPEEKPIGLRRVHVSMPATFDSRKTPKHGERRAQPKELVPVDLEKLRSKMAATIERAKQDDPRALRAELARLRAELKRVSATEKVPVRIERTKVHVLKDGQVGRLERALVSADGLAEKFLTHRESMFTIAREIRAALSAVPSAIGHSEERSVTREVATAEGTAVRAARPMEHRPPWRSVPAAQLRGREQGATRTDLPRGELATLRAVAQYDGGVARDQLSVLTGYRRSSRDAYVQRVRDRGYVEVAGDLIRATDAGVAALGDFESLPTGDALREYWMARLPAGERAALGVLVAAYPDAVERERISESTGYKRSSRDAYLSRLKARRLVVVVGSGQVRASDGLFPR